jgi:hypothetical protein
MLCMVAGTMEAEADPWAVISLGGEQRVPSLEEERVSFCIFPLLSLFLKFLARLELLPRRSREYVLVLLVPSPVYNFGE